MMMVQPLLMPLPNQLLLIMIIIVIMRTTAMENPRWPVLVNLPDAEIMEPWRLRR